MRQKRASADRSRRGIVDPRLLRYARATRTFISASVGLGGIAALLVIAQAWLLATVIAGAFDGKGLSELRSALAALLAVVAARAAVAWGSELAAGRSAALGRTVRGHRLHTAVRRPHGSRRVRVARARP